MKDNKQKFRLGLFVCGGLLLLLLILFFLGMSDLFTRKAILRTSFTESVQGLSVGSPVKYRGVPIGSVKRIAIRVADKLVQIDMEVQRDLFVDRSSSYSAFQRFVKKDMQQGLRCRLEYAGITGMKYIDFDYFVPPGSTMPTPPASMIADDVLYIPSVPSAFKDILSAVATSLDRIAHIRFEEISDGLERSLSDLSRLLSDPALHSAIARINAAAENLEAGSRTIAQVFDEQRIHELADTLQKNLNDINVLTNQLLKDSRDARFGESTSAFRTAAASVVDSQQQLTKTLDKLNRTLDSIKALSDSLEDDPSSLIRGKQRKTIQFKEQK